MASIPLVSAIHSGTYWVYSLLQWEEHARWDIVNCFNKKVLGKKASENLGLSEVLKARGEVVFLCLGYHQNVGAI